VVVLSDVSVLKEVLVCSERFERLVGGFYNALGERVGDQLLRVIFKWISVESLNHAELMKELLNFLKLPHTEVDCSFVIGEPWVTISLLMKTIEKDSINAEDLKKILSVLRRLEGLVGEETYGKLLYPAVSGLLREVGWGLRDQKALEAISTMLREVAVEEEYHEKLVNLIDELI